MRILKPISGMGHWHGGEFGMHICSEEGKEWVQGSKLKALL